MLANGRSLVSLIHDKSYDRTVAGKLFFLQEDKWRSTYAVLKANLLFFFESEAQMDCPIFLLIVEDCTVELSDDNVTGRSFSFAVQSKTTKRLFQLAAEDVDMLDSWISYLTVCSFEYLEATKLMYRELVNGTTTTEVKSQEIPDAGGEEAAEEENKAEK